MCGSEVSIKKLKGMVIFIRTGKLKQSSINLNLSDLFL